MCNQDGKINLRLKIYLKHQFISYDENIYSNIQLSKPYEKHKNKYHYD